MKILHCNTRDSDGGAAIAARRIHAALVGQGVDSRFGALRRTCDDPTVVQLGGRWRRLFDTLMLKMDQLPVRKCIKKGDDTFFSPALMPSRMDRSINALQADIVNLHWIAGSFLPIGALSRLTAPIVWTVHDAWPFTGGCHYPGECVQYREGCTACPHMRGGLGHALIRHCAAAKRKACARVKPTIVTPSAQFMEYVSRSSLTETLDCRHIPNAMDTTIFSPLEKALARQILGIPQHEVIVAFGALEATSDARKGFDLLMAALRSLPRHASRSTGLLIFGASHAPNMGGPYAVHCLGRLHDAIALRLAYCAADVFVCPSREENLPNTIMESLACGTPVAAFSVGGIPDMVEHGVNGCLAAPHDPEDLARCIAHILEDDERRACMGAAARKVVEERYAAPVIARQYMDLYQEVFERRTRSEQ